MSDPDYQHPAVLDELYNDRGMTQKEIGDKFGVSGVTILNWMNKHDIEVRGPRERQKPSEPSISMNYRLGYPTICHNEDRVYVHRLVGVAKYGYDAVVDDDAQIHHKNEVRLENGWDNIQLTDRKEHSEIHNEKEHDIDDTSYREKSTLVWLHENLGMTPTEIADRYTVTRGTIRKWLHRHDLLDTDDSTDATTTQPDTVDEDPQYSLSEFTEPAAD